ncbi:MAG: acyl-CoA dehydrogenase family protein [Myxococcales bacterium]|nr:acyl-CoA dehydrogenase family protein [Myxococcales bacterium]
MSLSALLSSARALGPLAPHPHDLDAWWRDAEPRWPEGAESVARAFLAGAHADRLAFAFAGGYEAALGRLDPSLTARGFAALCASEARGAHPRAIESTLVDCGDHWRLDGEKRFISGGPLAATLLVIATVGTRDGRPALKAAVLDRDTPGVTLTEALALPMVPELPHCGARFEAVRVSAHQLRAGDAYTEVLKPFRTLEDLHVWAAALGLAFRCLNGRDPEGRARARLAECLATLTALGREDPNDRGVHVVMAALWPRTREALEALFHGVEGEPGARLRRDLGLLRVADKARTARDAAALGWLAAAP